MKREYKIFGKDFQGNCIMCSNSNNENIIQFTEIDKEAITKSICVWLLNAESYVTSLIEKFGDSAYEVQICLMYNNHEEPISHKFIYKDYNLEEVTSNIRTKFNKHQRSVGCEESEEQTYLTKEEHSIAEKLKAMFSLILEYEYGFRKFRFVKKNGVPTYKDEIYKAMSSLDSHNSPRQCIMEAKEKLSVFGIDIVNGDITETNKIINEYYNAARNGGKAMKVFS